MADRVALMRRGRLAQIGPPTELYFAPRNAFVAGFFGEVNRIDSIVRNGRVETALGSVAAPEIPDGAPVEILIRPEALTLRSSAGAQDGPSARVLASRMLGRSSLVHLSVAAGNGADLHLHARIPGRFLPAEEEVLTVELDRSQAFVFPNGTA